MIIFRNIPGVITVYSNLKYLTQFKKTIDNAAKAGDKETEREYILKATSTWGKKITSAAKMNIEFYGKENLPKEGPVVYMCNHQGYADIPALCAVLDTVQFGFVAKQGLDKIPLYGAWVNRINSVFINRGNPREALKAITQGIGLIKEGYSLLIFPEGTRSQSSEMNEFKPGAMKLATKPKVPIVPISLDGTWRTFEETGMIKPSEVKIMVHPAIETKDLTKEEEKALNDKVYNIIKNGLDELKSK